MSRTPAAADPASLDAPAVDPAATPLLRLDHACLSAFSEPLRAMDYGALASEMDVAVAWFTDQLAACAAASPARLRRLLRCAGVVALVRLLTRAAGYFQLECVFAEDDDLPRLRALAERAAHVASALGAAPELRRLRSRPRAVQVAVDELGRGALSLPTRRERSS